MIEPRLAAHVRISAMLRRISAEGDFGTVLHKGDQIAGAILVVGREKGRNPRLFEQYPTLSAPPVWTSIGPQTYENEEELSEYLQKRIARDPDIWIIELDVAFAERLADILTANA